MIALWLTLTCACLNLALFVIPTEAPYILNILPTFAICRIFFYMASYCGYESCIGDFKNVNNELRYALGYMMLGSVIFTILGVYLHEVLPKQYGIRKNPIFCIEDEIKNCQRKNDKTDDMIIDDDNKKEKEENDDNNIKTNLIDNKNENENDENILLNDNNNPLKDKEIEKEFVNVKDIIDKGERELRKYPLVCNGLTKIYSSNLKSKDPKKKNKKSLDNFTICLKDNEIFGLLGPNGAGKTTFFSCLTGIYGPTSGSAFI